MRSEYLIPLLKKTKTEEIIAEGVVSRKSLGALKNYERSVLKETRGVLTVLYALDSAHLQDIESSIFTYNNTVWVMNIHQQFAVRIKSDFFALLIKQLIILTEEAGRKINVNELVSKELRG